MKTIALLLALPLLGCAPVKVTVYGANGAQYVAPSLCAAQLACKKAGEQACYYESLTLTNTDGSKEVDGCRVVKN